MTRVNIIGIFLEDGAVCTYFNYDPKGRLYESDDVIELPRRGTSTTAVVILGSHGMFVSDKMN